MDPYDPYAPDTAPVGIRTRTPEEHPTATATAATTEASRTTYVAPERGGPFSFAAGFLGWGTAMFFSLVLLSIVLAILGNAAYLHSNVNGNTVSISRTALNDLTWAGIVGAIVANNAAATYNFGACLQPYAIDWNAITTQAIVGLVLTFAVTLGAAILGGVAGERWYRRDVGAVEERRSTTWRGRPRV